MYFYQFEAFSAPCELHIDAPTSLVANEAARAIFENTKRLESDYSFFQDGSKIHELNHRSCNYNVISDELAGLIQLSLFYSNLTQGAFDIAMAGTLKELADVSTLHGYWNKKKLLMPQASSSHLCLEGNTLIFSNSTTKIDLGGLVKEYAVDQSVFMLQSLGIASALINFGGDLCAFGMCHDLPWRIGIQDPKDFKSNLVEIDVHNASVCTSGHSKRFTKIQEEKFSHIVIPTKNSRLYSQVSILAPTTVDAGIWSTSLLVNPELILPPHVRLIHNCTI